MTAWVERLKDGWAVFTQTGDPDVRGLRERKEAHQIAHDLSRWGRFKGSVMFRTGRRGAIELPMGLGQSVDVVPTPSGDGTVEDL